MAYRKVSSFPNVPAGQIEDTDLITGLHNGGNANFRIFDIVSHVMEGLDIDPGQDPGYHPGELGETVTYSVVIDHSKSDPQKMVTYADDAINLTPGWANLKHQPIFKKLRPCVLVNGVVQYYLDPDDYSKKEDGTAADITTHGNDVMIEYPERLGYKFEWLDENRLKVSVTNRPNAPGYSYEAFSYREYNDCDKIYLGAYRAGQNNGNVYSCSGVETTNTLAYDNAVDYCRARGEGYDLSSFAARTLVTSLFVIAHGTLDSQTSNGHGYMTLYRWTTGDLNSSGFDGEKRVISPSTYTHAKCFGMEDYWGQPEWVYGVRRNGDSVIISTVQSGNVSITGLPQDFTSVVHGTNVAGFLPKRGGGSETTKYCDFTWATANLPIAFGGQMTTGTAVSKSAGIFSTYTMSSQTTRHARLMYFHRG